MTSHTDLLDQPERLGGAFFGSILLHGSFAALLIGVAVMHPGGKVQWGDQRGGRMGSVAISTVSTINLPSKSGPVNPVATDTQSHVPTPLPEKTKAKAKPKEAPDAIPIASKKAPAKPNKPEFTEHNKFRDQQKYAPNQLYSTAGQATASPMYAMRGGGGVGVGIDSPFGNQFGAYATILRDRVAQSWKTTDIDPRIQTAPAAVISFSLLRNGNLVPGSVHISQTSGNRALDYSAQRAVLDAQPFPQLPAQFNKNQADIELRFELRR